MLIPELSNQEDALISSHSRKWEQYLVSLGSKAVEEKGYTTMKGNLSWNQCA